MLSSSGIICVEIWWSASSSSHWILLLPGINFGGTRWLLSRFTDENLSSSEMVCDRIQSSPSWSSDGTFFRLVLFVEAEVFQNQLGVWHFVGAGTVHWWFWILLTFRDGAFHRSYPPCDPGVSFFSNLSVIVLSADLCFHHASCMDSRDLYRRSKNGPGSLRTLLLLVTGCDWFHLDGHRYTQFQGSDSSSSLYSSPGNVYVGLVQNLTGFALGSTSKSFDPDPCIGCRTELFH